MSRDVLTLDAGAMRESAIESLAENLNDSVVAPLFWFALLGLPGAALYRFANTADAMWGYRGERNGRKHGIILRPLPHRMSYSPPLIITEEEIVEMGARTRAALDDTYAEVKGL